MSEEVLTIELPDEVKEDKHCRKYIKIDHRGLVLAIYERAVTERDNSEVITIVINDKEEQRKVPTYYGEWRAVPQEEIDKINEANRKSGKISKSTMEKINNNQREIEELEALIARLRANRKEE